MKTKRILLGIIAVFLLIIQFTLQLDLARLDSQTTDEGVHLSAGLTYLTKKDFRFNPEHPPLVKMLAALPLLEMKISTPSDEQYFNKAGDFFYDSWREARGYAEGLLYNCGNNADLILLGARIPMIFLTLLLALTIFAISSRIWGIKAGFLSLVLFILEPIILANGHLVTTDIAVALGYLASVYVLWIFLKRPNWKNIILFGLVLGLTELAKFTAIIALPAIVVLFIYFAVIYKIRFSNCMKLIGKLIISACIALVVIWGGYFFNQTAFPSSSNLPLDRRINAIFTKAHPVLIPRDYYKGLGMVIGHTEGGHDSFLLGQKSKTGWWYYFPVLLSAKTSIPLLVLILFSIILILINRKKNHLGVFLLIAALIYLAFAMLSKANLGVRHILPVYAIFFVLIGSTTNLLVKNTFTKIILGLLIVWFGVESYFVYPNFLSYYNELYGGTDNGYKIANDSNYDWGQDLKRIKLYLDEHPEINNPLIEYPWDSTKAIYYYQIKAQNAESFNGNFPKGYLIIGSTFLNNPPFDSLQKLPIYDRITPAVFVYQIK